MRFCKHCVMPDTRPGLHLNSEGVCEACASYENRQEIDWRVRRRELEQIFQVFEVWG